jgi:hypothetical protein
MLSLLGKLPVAEDLEVNQAHADRQTPKQKHRSQQVEPGILSEAGITRHENRRSSSRQSLVV